MSEMNLCDDGHDQIVWYGHPRHDQCPLCKANDQIEELESSKKELEESVESLKSDISKLETDLEEATAEEEQPEPPQPSVRRIIAFFRGAQP